MEKVRIEKLIKWKQSVGIYLLDIMTDFVNPLMEAFGNDVNEIIAYLNMMDDKDLLTASSAFEDIYKKFMTDDVWNALGALEQRLKESNQI